MFQARSVTKVDDIAETRRGLHGHEFSLIFSQKMSASPWTTISKVCWCSRVLHSRYRAKFSIGLRPILWSHGSPQAPSLEPGWSAIAIVCGKIQSWLIYRCDQIEESKRCGKLKMAFSESVSWGQIFRFQWRHHRCRENPTSIDMFPYYALQAARGHK